MTGSCLRGSAALQLLATLPFTVIGTTWSTSWSQPDSPHSATSRLPEGPSSTARLFSLRARPEQKPSYVRLLISSPSLSSTAPTWVRVSCTRTPLAETRSSSPRPPRDNRGRVPHVHHPDFSAIDKLHNLETFELAPITLPQDLTGPAPKPNDVRRVDVFWELGNERKSRRSENRPIFIWDSGGPGA